MYSLLRFVPKNHLSFCIGKLAEIPVPKFLRSTVIGGFARCVGADVDEAEKSVIEYGSVADFFTRELRSGIRPTQGHIVSPVDGNLRSIERIDSDTLIQAKGKFYSLSALLNEDGARFIGGWCYNFYLSPRDYHRVHFPIAGKVTATRRIAGKLWPVNNWAIAHVTDLFSQNERVVTSLSSDQGTVAIIMVGACNVGKISLQYSLHSDVVPGDPLGTFHLGSTVIVLFSPEIALRPARSPGPIQLGASL